MKDESLPAIQTHELAVGFGKPVFSNLNLTVQKGEVVTIMGENGCGKTLLFQTLLGVLKPLCGTVHLFGLSPRGSNQANIQRKVAWVTSVPEDFPWGTRIRDYFIARQAFYPGWNHKLQVDLCLNFSLESSKRISELSLGENSKMRLISALAQSPDLLILDELTANLSPTSKQGAMQAIIDAIISRQMSVLSFSHLQPKFPSSWAL